MTWCNVIQQIALLGPSDAEVEHARKLAKEHQRLRAHEADFTPRGAARQAVRVVVPHLGAPVRQFRMIDPCAGAGVFADEVSLAYPGVLTHAFELRDEERNHLDRNADFVVMGDAVEVIPRVFGLLDRAELMLGNPAFSLLTEIVEVGYQAVRPGGHIVLLGLSQWGQAEDVSEWLKVYTPVAQYRVGGRLKFRNGTNPKTAKPYGHDSREYSWWCWRVPDQLDHVDAHGSGLPGWRTYQLPMLPREDREWTVKPGTEERAGRLSTSTTSSKRTGSSSWCAGSGEGRSRCEQP